MSDLIVLAIWLALAVGMGALGRWVYVHPERALEKFNPYGKPYGSFSIRFARIVGALWLFGAAYGFFAGLFVSFALRVVPAPIVTAILVALASLTSWQLVKSTRT